MTHPAIKKHATLPNLIVSIGLLFFILTFSRSIAAMAEHGFTWHFLIFPLFFYLVYDQRNRLKVTTSAAGSTIGLIVVAGAHLLLFAGEVSSTLVVSEFALIFGIWGCVVVFLGFRGFRILLWPLIYLFFISSSLDTIFNLLTPVTRLFTAKIATFLAGCCGYTVISDETYIRLPAMVLNVADECSGINHLISLAAIAFPIGYLYRFKPLAFALFLISTLPVAIFSNSLRVFVIILFNYHRTVFTHGPSNILVTGSGFFIGLVLLFAVSWGIDRLFRSPVPAPAPQKPESAGPSNGLPRNLSLLSAVPLCALLAAGFLFVSFWKVHDDRNRPDSSVFTNDPLPSIEIASVSTIPGLQNLPVADAEYRFKCVDHNNNTLFVYLGWYKKQEVRKEVAGYLYDVVLQGCTRKQLSFNAKTAGVFRACHSDNPDESLVYLVQYLSQTGVTDQPEITKLHAVLNALLHRTTSAAIVIFSVPAQNGIIDPEAQKIVGTLLPLVHRAVLN